MRAWPPRDANFSGLEAGCLAPGKPWARCFSSEQASSTEATLWSGLDADILQGALRGIGEYERYRERVLAENVRRARRSTGLIRKETAIRPPPYGT